MHRLGLVIILCAVFVAGSATAQSGRRAAAGALEGLARGLSDVGERQAALEAEIELARAKAAIELDLQRKLAADREARRQRVAGAVASAPAKPISDSARREFDILDRSYPAWFEHAESANFKRWMASQPQDMQARFAKVQTATELLSMINEHRLSLGMDPVKLQK